MPDPKPPRLAKLTPDQAREIRRLLAEQPVSYATLARRYGVSEPTISHIANAQTWRHLLEPPPPEMQQLFAAVHGDQKAMDAFARMNAGTISPAEFFAPENVNAITAAA